MYTNIEINLFQPQNKTVSKNMNFQISGQKITASSYVKCLGVLIDQQGCII